MDLNDYVENLMVNPAMTSWKDSPENKRKAVAKVAQQALDKICRIGVDVFEFATANATGTTVVDQNNYTCEGTSSQCAQVMTIKYDGAKYQLPKKTKQQRDVFMEGRTGNLTSIQFWSPTAIVNGHPEVTFYGTPGSVVNFAYEYRRMGISLQEFPADFSDVLETVAIALLFGHTRVANQFGNAIYQVSDPAYLERASKIAIEEMMDDYESDDNLYPDPPFGKFWRNTFRRNNRKFGYHA